MIQRILTPLGIAALALLAGCASRGGTITLQPAQGGPARQQAFNQAYIAQPTSGNYEVILMDSAALEQQGKRKPGAPLAPLALTPLRQVMRIHLFWRPISMSHGNPAAVNAAIEWHVLGDEPGQSIVYKGAGYVTFEGRGDTRDVFIRDGHVKPAQISGGLVDPVGPATISGHATARVSAARVRDALTEIRAEPEPKQQ